MTFTLEIETDNDAFKHNYDAEIMRILHDIANRFVNIGIPLDGMGRRILDANGNTCGEYNLIDD